ncbi:hypothetical protein [Parasphingorhabdus cellanae]|uniref:Nucleotidyltransferase n=1 Tax=Parasphingorhabdus cellanae TaxID=2806553 RepID=A0ABX7T2D9_9SPHN|nr:hypothetical protein [Parasphingorhabdus cellanae]QTD55733.1 hypothetical protein J4G78_16305 [Parasphingorhabdus cellanae]
MSYLEPLIGAELAEPVELRVSSFAEAIAEQYCNASCAVLFYGSCLRTTELEGQMLDFYLIVSSYEAAYGKSWLVRANELLPPNVFPAEHDGLIAKVAVLSEADFHKLNGPEASAVSVWARFAQPSRLVWCADEAARKKIIAAIARAPVTLFELTLPVLGIQPQTPIRIFHRGFALTYSAELRAERKNRSGSVVDADLDRYERFGLATMATLQDQDPSESGELSFAEAQKRWKTLRRNGKFLTLARLAKASGTYAGGIDYLAWKINRHAGTNYEIKPWQRKWPILGAITMLPRLIAGGAIK